jgi:AcrR family transcriptional regulator
VADPNLTALPKGRHSLTREQVADAQRLRLAVAMAEAMADSGYVGTPVAAVLQRAGVSRQTFYELYDGKLACFLDALDLVGEVLVVQLAGSLGRSGEPIDQAARAVEQYLETLVDQPAFARLFLVEVHAAGPAAMQRRAELQARVVDALAELFRVRTRRGRFACQAYVAAIASLVTVPLATGDTAAIRALRRPLIDHLRLLAEHVR